MKRESVSTRVKLKIVPHLLRSRQAAEMFPANIQVMLIFQSYLLVSLMIQFLQYLELGSIVTDDSV